VAALIASMGALTLGFATTGMLAASADPPYNATAGNPVVGVGSNTIEDVLNAFTGQEPSPGLTGSKLYSNVLWNPATGTRAYSFDAENPYNTSAGGGCIQSKIGSLQFDRPNGSGNGRISLSDEESGVPWYQAGGCNNAVATASTLTGLVDFSRSSSHPPTSYTCNEPSITGPPFVPGCTNTTTAYNTYLPSIVAAANVDNDPGAAFCSPAGASNTTAGLIANTATTTTGVGCLTFIPFAHDAQSYAYWAGAQVPLNAIDQLTGDQGTTELHTLYNAGPGTETITFNAVNYTLHACLPNTGSGTTQFWTGAIGVTIPNALTAATNAGCINEAAGPPAVAIEENSGDGFKNAVNLATANAGPGPTDIWVIPFSVANWVAQGNKASQDRSSTLRAVGVWNTANNPNNPPGTAYADLGDPDAVPLNAGAVNDEPYNLSGGVYSPDPNYYASTGTTNADTWGRDVYVVLPWKVLNGAFPAFKQADVNMFGTCTTNAPLANCALSSHPTVGTADGLPVICEGTVNGGTVAGPQDSLATFGLETESSVAALQTAPSPTPQCGQEVPLNTAQGPTAGGGLATAGSIYATPGHG
jgi:hypothetical protein